MELVHTISVLMFTRVIPISVAMLALRAALMFAEAPLLALVRAAGGGGGRVCAAAGGRHAGAFRCLGPKPNKPRPSPPLRRSGPTCRGRTSCSAPWAASAARWRLFWRRRC